MRWVSNVIFPGYMVCSECGSIWDQTLVKDFKYCPECGEKREEEDDKSSICTEQWQRG